MRTRVVIKKALLVLMDAALLVAAAYLALLLRFETAWNVDFTNTFTWLPAIVCIYLVVLVIGGLYDILWKYAGVNEVLRLAMLATLGCILLLLLNRIFRCSISRPVLVIMAILAVALLGGVRLLARMIVSKKKRDRASAGVKSPRLMIVGAGIAGSYVMSMCKQDPGLGTPVVLVDDDPLKLGLRIQGVSICGRTEDIPALVTAFQIDDIIIAIPSLKGAALTRVVEICQKTSCRVRISSQIRNSDDVIGPENMFVRELNISDFLSREEIALQEDGIREYLTDKVVLVTGGGGSIGSELARQIMRFAPEQLVIFDIYENCAYELACELRQRYGADCPVQVLIGSVRDENRLAEVFEQVRPTVVFHAAAHKHVPLMETSPAEAVKNNVFGTLNVLRAADKYGVQRFVLLSTDKAVNPTNVMGATKRITEMLIQHFARKTEMKCMAVRFGNVLGSHGSVIPLFERQIKAGGPVTVTHPDIIRYFMTIPEAAQLVLQAGAIAKSGSIFVLNMGEPVRIYDLAEQLIRFYGYEPNVNMEIRITGLRPGEKLYEELLTADEQSAMERTEHDRILVAPPIPQDEAQFAMQLDALRQAAKRNDARVLTVIHEIVPGFRQDAAEEDKQAG